MNTVDKIQTSRHEFKYLIDERTARAIRSFTCSYLEPDPFTRGREGRGYPVHSLYLDSRNLMTCRATQCGEKNRFKLRLRFYDDNPDSPVFFEIKGRENQVIKKQRAQVKRSRAPALMGNEFPQLSDLLKPNQQNMSALVNFCLLRDQIQARPTAYTSYLREGYEPVEGNNVRVTFDRELQAGEYRGQLSVADLEQWARPDIPGVVLELKFNDRFPEWMHELAEWFELQRTSVPKYVECVNLLRHNPVEIPLEGTMLESETLS